MAAGTLALAISGCGGGGGGKTVTVTRTAAPPAATTPTATTPEKGLAGTLTPHGLGSVRIAMRQDEVEQAVGGKLTFRGDFCAAPPTAEEGVFVEFDQSPRVDAVGVENGATIKTDKGLGLGDPVARVRELYGAEAEQVTPDSAISGGQGTDFVVRPASGPDHAFQLDIWSTNGKVTGMYAVKAGDRRDEFCA